MNLLEKLSNTESGIKNGAEMLSREFFALNNEGTKAMFASFKAGLESSLSGKAGSYVFGRVKAPISSCKKFSEDEKYSSSWNKIKDMIAYTIVIDGGNDDVDQVRALLCHRFEISGLQNPNCPKLYEDYMRSTVRKDEYSKSLYVYQDPAGRHYQTNDGYKNVKLNLMLNGYPIEVQIKTMQQLMAHCATHDAIYKAPRYLFEGRTDEEKAIERNLLSDKMFPYFEANAYLRLNQDRLSHEEIVRIRADIKEIYDRNFEFYNKYASVFNDAKADFGVYLFKLMHKKEFQSEAMLSKDGSVIDFSTYEIKKVFNYMFKQISKENPSITRYMAITKTIDQLLETPYSEYKAIRDELKGEYRLSGCVLTGEFDGLTESFMSTVKKASDIFKTVHIKTYGDEFAEALTGHKPIFNLQQRLYMLESCKYVTSVAEVKDFRSKPIESLPKEEPNEEPEEKYSIVSITGVMDGCTPGHIKLLQHALSLAGENGKVYVGIKSDDYVNRVKHKSTINSEEERAETFRGLRGVSDVYITDNDILPNEAICNEMQEAIANGKRCAIVTGSDWANPAKRATKPESSLKEMEFIESTMPGVDVVAAPPRGTKDDFKTNDGREMSSSNLKELLIAQKEAHLDLPVEIRELEEVWHTQN